MIIIIYKINNIIEIFSFIFYYFIHKRTNNFQFSLFSTVAARQLRVQKKDEEKQKRNGKKSCQDVDKKLLDCYIESRKIKTQKLSTNGIKLATKQKPQEK